MRTSRRQATIARIPWTVWIGAQARSARGTAVALDERVEVACGGRRGRRGPRPGRAGRPSWRRARAGRASAPPPAATARACPGAQRRAAVTMPAPASAQPITAAGHVVPRVAGIAGLREHADDQHPRARHAEEHALDAAAEPDAERHRDQHGHGEQPAGVAPDLQHRDGGVGRARRRGVGERGVRGAQRAARAGQVGPEPEDREQREPRRGDPERHPGAAPRPQGVQAGERPRLRAGSAPRPPRARARPGGARRGGRRSPRPRPRRASPPSCPGRCGTATSR